MNRSFGLTAIQTADPSLWGRHALVVYRYLSLALTSAFYLAGPPDSPVLVKLGVVLALFVAARLSVYLYYLSGQSEAGILRLVLAETLGIAFLLLPTGGIDSPFVWYALNPILMAASYLPAVLCWGTMGVFLATVLVSSILFAGSLASTVELAIRKSWVLLVLVLLTLAAQLLAGLVRRLQDAYLLLAKAHAESQRSLEHVASLYQALEAFSAQDSTARLAQLLAAYAEKLTGCPAACWLTPSEKQEGANPVLEVSSTDDRAVWAEGLARLWVQAENDPRAETHVLTPEGLAGSLVCVPVKSQSECFGLLGFNVLEGQDANGHRRKALQFLAELGGIVLERMKADRLWTHLQVAEEQNRIANEIHDGVSQQLFSIVFALHALAQKKGDLQDEEVQRQLDLIKKTANQGARELRTSIYHISPRKRGEQVFVSGLSSYLKGFAQLNGIEADMETEGSEEALSPALRKALYRIVREATANAFRHGACSRVRVFLKMAPGKMLLRVSDDGRGFDPARLADSGLGLTNMKNLMASFGGGFTVDSAPGRGTTITCTIPAETDRCLDSSGTGGADVESRCG